ncbi:tetratricopeptide repeat protein 28-like [Orbicella faveolata]|uniref:tetratricopeptide repeat protein 28-like n=1 Tax=Orbicella faveolata TaxID=48498 RepID=UPI0009E1A6DA|nr:tetratricopeptide repeat protein 28-like [Orbicella faveolata]
MSVGEYDKAKKYTKKALEIRIETGDRAGEAADYGNLGIMFKSPGERDKAKEYLEKALEIRMEIAKEYVEKALSIGIEIGDRAKEAANYGNLGTVMISVGEYDKAKKYTKKALEIRIEIGDRAGEAADYGNLGIMFKSLGEYEKANEYLGIALAIRTEIGDRVGEAADYGNLGIIGGEAADYGNLGTVFYSLGEYDMAEVYLEKGLSVTRDIGDLDKEITFLGNLTMLTVSQGKIQGAFDLLLLSLDKSESLRDFLRENDQFKISFSDAHDFIYRNLCLLFCFTGNPKNALYVLELARARALTDLMTTQYSVEWQISANPKSWIGIENIMTKESNCPCLYISYSAQLLFLWVLKTSGVIHFRAVRVDEHIGKKELLDSLDEFFAKSFRSFGVLPEEDCEDRSLNAIVRELKSCKEERRAALRLEEGDDEESQNPESSLSLCYRIFIDSVADLLQEREIIIFPDHSLNQVPFAALTDKDGKYLSETFRIRIVPSLTTLKPIQGSPADYHSQTGALVLGNPDVCRVRYKGSKKYFSRLPCAGNEAAMIGRLLGIQPLIGQLATKQAVLERLPSVGLVYLAAHGNAERGEITLSPTRSSNKIPKEDEYLLTIPDIAKVQLRAKLVVLSCCHSARGQIRAEGVIGIARAFLGSGARSVLVALWAIKDSATEQLMCRFYEHLVRGKSVSESLHQAMTWMKGNDFAKVRNWAPFMLIGDDVTFEFEKHGK